MPRYDFYCKACEGETSIFTPEDIPVEMQGVTCEHCGVAGLKLVAYYFDDKAMLYAIQYQIDLLIQKVDTIIESVGADI